MRHSTRVRCADSSGNCQAGSRTYTLGVAYLIDSLVNECSGGECQRIAIARLLLQDTRIILADEPTGSLDHLTKLEIFELLKMLKKQGKTIVVVTHDEDLKAICERHIEIYPYANNQV
ncbi:MAG: ATP-binding cassette domain-containing protein [Erysipelotrichaceae bacterium]